MGLLKRALKCWLRQLCQAIAELRIRLEATAAGLLRERLEEVRLSALEVLCEHRPGGSGEGTAPVQTAALLRRSVLELEDPLQVRGQVVFRGAGLGRSLQADRWRSLGDALASELLGTAPPLAGQRQWENHLLLLAPHPPPTQRRP